MVRISEVDLTDEGATLRLEGRVVGTMVAEVKKACEAYLLKGVGLTLDLADLLFADRDGIALLLELIGRQVKLVNCSPFLREQLRQAGAPCS